MYVDTLEGSGGLLQGPALVYWAAAKQYESLQNATEAKRCASLTLKVVGKRGWREREVALRMIEN